MLFERHVLVASDSPISHRPHRQTLHPKMLSDRSSLMSSPTDIYIMSPDVCPQIGVVIVPRTPEAFSPRSASWTVSRDTPVIGVSIRDNSVHVRLIGRQWRTRALDWR